MWGFLIGLYLAMIIYPLLQEWRQRRQAIILRLAACASRHAPSSANVRTAIVVK
jgi:hypothetical protein